MIFDDQFARQDSNGNWHCTDCMKEEANNDVIRLAPKSLAAKNIIAERSLDWGMVEVTGIVVSAV